MSTLKPYSVEISIVTVVMASDEDHAIDVAKHTAGEALRDLSAYDYDYGTPREIKTDEHLARVGWDKACLPYGGDGRTTLKDILAEIQGEPLPERDTKTIDMFEDKQS
ncbi:hypothetical protein [Caballeronia sp. LZ043]|uniref:hypothetical protein n=1 Tax=Caballeronia sp. LZ043 TaxID=3038569 RepID=UPI002863901A|nr:hypothetical protein [Caballeronia sp. LZ043]MDR5824728.1 hypothetical protein [Caballeronia sp. LZ043]